MALIQSCVGWEVYGHVWLYLMLCCLRALGGEAGFGAVGVVGWELLLQAVALGLGEAEAQPAMAGVLAEPARLREGEDLLGLKLSLFSLGFCTRRDHLPERLFRPGRPTTWGPTVDPGRCLHRSLLHRL